MKRILSSILVFTLIAVPASGVFAAQSSEGQTDAKAILRTAENDCLSSVFNGIFDKAYNEFEKTGHKASFNYYDLQDNFVSCYASKFSKEDLEKNVMAYFNKPIEGQKQDYINYCVDFYVNQTEKAFSGALDKFLANVPNIININYDK